MQGRLSGDEGRRTQPYMKKTPADHAGGSMAERSSVRREKGKRTEKNENFSEKFLFSVTSGNFLEKGRRLARNG